MKVGNNPNTGAVQGDDLLGRMRQAHDEEVAAATGNDAASGAEASTETLSLEEAQQAAATDQADRLERGMLKTARDVLESKFEQPGEVREAVVDSIVDARYGAFVEGEHRQDIVDSVKETLSNDVAFRSEVDNMLIHAARRLGRAQGTGADGR